MLDTKIAYFRSCSRITRLQLVEDHVLLRMVARIRIVFEVVNDPYDHLVVGAVAAIKHAKFLLEYLQQFLDVSMLLAQDLDDVGHLCLLPPALRILGLPIQMQASTSVSGAYHSCRAAQGSAPN